MLRNLISMAIMSKFKKSQILLLSLLVALLVISPLLSPSLRPTYLYLVLNFLIISLGAEAGLVSLFFKSPEVAAISVSSPKTTTQLQLDGSRESSPKDKKKDAPSSASACKETKKTKVVEKCCSEKINVGGVKVDRVKKCASMPSLFFIGSGEADAQDIADDQKHEEEDEEVAGGQELFAKAENFIGNFYKQLKMQREESWKRIHGFYQKAF